MASDKPDPLLAEIYRLWGEFESIAHITTVDDTSPYSRLDAIKAACEHAVIKSRQQLEGGRDVP